MKHILIIFGSMMLLFSSCKKCIGINHSLVDSAQTILRSKMQQTDYELLDWINAKSQKYNNIEILVTVPSKLNKSENLYFSHFKGHETFNWVLHEKYLDENGRQIEKFILKNIENQVINTLTIYNTKIPSMEANNEAIVYTSIPRTNNVALYGLYWLFNYNPIYNNLYSMEPGNNSSRYGGSIYEIVFNSRLFPPFNKSLTMSMG